MRFRTMFNIGGTALVLAALFLTDPDKGAATGMIVLGLATCIIAIAMSHLARKAIFDYRELDMRELLRKASETSLGSAIIFLAVTLAFNAFLALFGRALHAQPLPANAVIYAPVLKAEQQRFWPDHPAPALLAGLVEQESCVSLKSVRCWSPGAKLKNEREEGAGLGQITRAYRPDGSVRFDSLEELRQQYPDLRDWSWNNVYQRPDLQLRALVLMNRSNYQALRTVALTYQRLAFTDAAYNGGLGGVQRERRACQMKSGCDPQLWFGHVEHTCLKSREALYGARSACDINREHVHLVLRVRSSKYQSAMT